MMAPFPPGSTHTFVPMSVTKRIYYVNKVAEVDQSDNSDKVDETDKAHGVSKDGEIDELIRG